MLIKCRVLSFIAVLGCFCLISPPAFSVESVVTASDTAVFTDYDQHRKKGLVGVGLAAVRFDTKLRFTEKQSGVSVFLDPEGQLGLPEVARVNTFYAAFRLGEKHVIGTSYFAVKRDSTIFREEINLEDLVVLRGEATITDNTKYYFIDYGYSLFRDDRSYVLGLFGIAGLDLKYKFDAFGEIIINGVTSSGTYSKEASVFAPLPLIGIDLSFAFTPKWSVATKVALVTGSYQGTRASAIQARTDARYWFTEYVGGVIGLSYFNADVTIEKENETQEIGYAYGGAYAGLHFVF